MVSPTRSASASPEPCETMQIFVKNINGDTIPLIIPTEITHTNLLTLLSLRTSLPASGLRLVHAGKHLSPSSPDTTLLSQGIKPESTLHLAAPLRGGMPPKKVRCTHKDCREVAQRIVGDCGFCNGRFCGKHRLLEDHKCTGLEDCKKESHDRNAAQLNKERTTVIKGI